MRTGLATRRSVRGRATFDFVGKAVLAMVAAGLVTGWSSAGAADSRLVPSLELREEYIDNLFFDADDPESDFITTVSPSLAFARDTERVKFNLSGRLGWAEYAEHDAFGKVDQNYLGTLGFQRTSRLGFSVNGGYLQDYRPDRDLFVNGLLFDTVRRERWVTGGGVSYAMTERSRLEGNYSFTSERFPGGDFSDSDTHSLSGSHAFNWTPRLTQSLTLGYSHAEYDTARLDNLVLQIGAATSLTESWTLDLGIGGRYTRSAFERYEQVFAPPFLVYVRRDERSGETGGVAHLGLNYRSERDRITLEGGHDVQLASGRSSAVKQTSGAIELTRRFSREFSGSLRGGYYLNRADTKNLAETEIDNRSLRLSAGLRWDLSPDWGVSLDYQWVRYDNRPDDSRAKRQLIALRLFYRIPLWD